MPCCPDADMVDEDEDMLTDNLAPEELERIYSDFTGTTCTDAEMIADEDNNEEIQNNDGIQVAKLLSKYKTIKNKQE